MPFPPRQSGDHWLGDTGSVSGANGRNGGRSNGARSNALSAMPVYAPDDSSPERNTGNWGQYTMPGVQPSYSATMPTFAALPETRPLEYLARRQRPRWGLRFMFLLVVAGGAAYLLKPYVPWIDARVTPVERMVRGQIAKYRATIGPMIGLGDPAPAPAPVAAPVPPPVAPVAARPVVEAPPRPGIEPIVPRANRNAAAMPVAATGARVVVPARATAAASKGFGRAGTASARAGGGRYLGAGKAARPMSRAAARRAARASMQARSRGSRAAVIAAAAAARAEAAAAAPSVVEVTPPEPAVVEVPTPSLPAAPPSAAPAKEPVAVAAAEKAAPPPAAPAAKQAAEDDRSVNSLVQSAARSGDELDRLMAGAVQSRSAARPAADSGSAIERKLADVQKPRVAAGAANAAGISRQPLSRADISMVMQDVQKNVRDCFRQHGKGGVADVKVDVAPEGNVIGTIIRGDLAGTPSGACVETRLKAAIFPPSTGMRFDYRLLVK
jgi:hypothetical protein